MSTFSFEDLMAAQGFDMNDVKANLAAPETVPAPPQSDLTVLRGDDDKKQQGSFVLSGQTLAADAGFRNVSKIWYDKTMSFEDGLDSLEKGRALTHDIEATVNEMVATVNPEGKFAFYHRPTEEFFTPTEHAMGQIGNWAKTGTWYVENMLRNPVDLKGRELYARDKQDAECLAHVIRNGMRRVDEKKKFLWRTRKDGTLRAMLTERFAIIDNRWLLELFSKIIPGARLSHWRGDSDTLWGNLLIPDSVRKETDSEYGGMLSIGNSEIGERRVSSVPSIFRAICMNGCIWGQTKGKGINQVHRGKIDLNKLALEIKTNVDAQIPLLPQGIDRLLGLRSFGWDGAEAKPIVAGLATHFKVGKRQASGILQGYVEEVRATPDYQKTAFSLVNAVTRAGQRLENKDWLAFDEYGGQMSEWGQTEWDRLYSRGKSMTVKEVDEAFA